MPGLWQTLLRRWLGPQPPPDLERLCPHLRRDIGCEEVPPYGRGVAETIPYRNFSHDSTFCALPAPR